jgi:hypothetical protein
MIINIITESQVWWCRPIIPACRRLRQEDCKFEVSGKGRKVGRKGGKKGGLLEL